MQTTTIVGSVIRTERNSTFTRLIASSAFVLGLCVLASADLGSTRRLKCDSFVKKEVDSIRPEMYNVIVQLTGKQTVAHDNQMKQLKGKIKHRFGSINAFSLNLPMSAIKSLADKPFVKRISWDMRVGKSDAFTVEHSGAKFVWGDYGVRGNGVTVAVVDSGIAGHEDLTGSSIFNSRVIARVNFANTIATNYDDCGHGTHVAGLIAGNSNMAQGNSAVQSVFGSAPSSKLVSVRVLDHTGSGTVSSVMAGLEWTLANRAKYNIRVVNISLGHSIAESHTTDPLCLMVEKLWKSGIVVVAAAGNTGRKFTEQAKGLENEGWGVNYGSIESPGNSPYAITVGAMKIAESGKRDDDLIATYSGRGPSVFDHVLKPDIVAPGNRVISLGFANSFLNSEAGEANHVMASEIYNNKYGSSRGTDLGSVILSHYIRLSGTSMAAPVVSGAVALMLEKYPTLSPDTVKARLMQSASKWSDQAGVYDPGTFGAGFLDVSAAMRSKIVATVPALSPTLSVMADGSVKLDAASLFCGAKTIWGTGTIDASQIWGSRAIWGSDIKVTADTIWRVNSEILGGSRALWGTVTVQDNRAIWGSDSGLANPFNFVLSGD